MKSNVPVGVTSRSFSRHAVLREELLQKYDNVRFNDKGECFDRITLIEFCLNRRKLITALEVFDDEIISALPNL